MVKPVENKLRTYHVTLVREGEAYARAETHGHTMYLGVRRGDPSAGFNAAETLLAALGACLLTNINSLAQKMHILLREVRVDIEGVRRDKPPALIEVTYRLHIDSPAPAEKLQKLHELAIEWGTVYNTLLNGVPIHGELVNTQGEDRAP